MRRVVDAILYVESANENEEITPDQEITPDPLRTLPRWEWRTNRQITSGTHTDTADPAAHNFRVALVIGKTGKH